MFGNFFSNFSLPPLPFDDVDPQSGTNLAGQGSPSPAAPGNPPAPGSPSPLDVLIEALEALAKLDKSYSSAISRAFSAIGALLVTSGNARLLA